MTTRDSLQISLKEKRLELGGISPKVSSYQKLKKEIEELEIQLGKRKQLSTSKEYTRIDK